MWRRGNGRMKILFIYKYCILGGVTTQLVNRLKALKASHEVHFLFLYEYGGLTALKDHPYKYIGNTKEDLEALIEEHHYDVLSIIDTPEVYDWLGKMSYKGKCVHEVHTTTSNIKQLTQLRESLPMDMILTPSYYMKKLIEEEYGFKDQVPVEVVYNCLDRDNFQYVPYNKPTDKAIILWVGKLDDHKRWRDFVEICSRLDKLYQMKNLEYVMVGGVTAKEEIIDELVLKLIQFDLLDKVKWYSSVDYQDMARMYSKVYKTQGVYVSTSINESFGMTVVEASVLKVPVVVPRVGALEEICASKKESSLYTLGNLDEACRLIIDQLEHQQYLEDIDYSCEQTCKQFVEAIEKIDKKEG